MKRKLLARRPSPAMVVAVVALVSSLTGGAVAATLITTADIKNGTVGTKDIKNAGVTAKDLKKNSVRTKKVKNGTLLSDDFAPGEFPGTGPQGLQGPKGDKGDTGEAGATNVVVRREDVGVPAGGTGIGSADCEDDERATGGGFNAGGTAMYATQSAPSSDGGSNTSSDGSTPNSWRVQIFSTGGATTGVVYVICASP